MAMPCLSIVASMVLLAGSPTVLCAALGTPREPQPLFQGYKLTVGIGERCKPSCKSSGVQAGAGVPLVRRKGPRRERKPRQCCLHTVNTQTCFASRLKLTHVAPVGPQLTPNKQGSVWSHTAPRCKPGEGKRNAV